MSLVQVKYHRSEEKPERLEKLKNAKQGNDSVDSYKGQWIFWMCHSLQEVSLKLLEFIKIVRIHQAYRIRRMSSIFLAERFFLIFIMETEQENLERIFLIVSNLKFSFSHFDPVTKSLP